MCTSVASVVSLWFSFSQYRTTAKAARVAATACDATKPCSGDAFSSETVNRKMTGAVLGVQQPRCEIGEETATAAG